MSALIFLWGALAMGSWVVGLFFLKFWRASRDRLFIFFAAAFWVFSLNWIALALVEGAAENRHLIYLLRLVAFGLIIIAVIDKNRRNRLG